MVTKLGKEKQSRAPASEEARSGVICTDRTIDFGVVCCHQRKVIKE